MPVGTAREAYDDLAPDYDLLTADYPYERWLAALAALARSHGLEGRDVLDVACGTGKSFLPLLQRGWRVVGCDISSAMLGVAAAKAPGVRLVQADMRSLGRLGDFDLVTCLDDALNYVLQPRELEAALAGIRRNLRPRGVRARPDHGPRRRLPRLAWRDGVFARAGRAGAGDGGRLRSGR